jgi:hypothetical protein
MAALKWMWVSSGVSIVVAIPVLPARPASDNLISDDLISDDLISDDLISDHLHHPGLAHPACQDTASHH